MQISLRCRLDTSTDRFVIEFEAGEVASTRPIAIDGLPEPAQLELDAQGYIVSLAIPGLAKGLKALAGEKTGKGGK